MALSEISYEYLSSCGKGRHKKRNSQRGEFQKIAHALWDGRLSQQFWSLIRPRHRSSSGHPSSRLAAARHVSSPSWQTTQTDGLPHPHSTARCRFGKTVWHQRSSCLADASALQASHGENPFLPTPMPISPVSIKGASSAARIRIVRQKPRNGSISASQSTVTEPMIPTQIAGSPVHRGTGSLYGFRSAPSSPECAGPVNLLDRLGYSLFRPILGNRLPCATVREVIVDDAVTAGWELRIERTQCIHR